MSGLSPGGVTPCEHRTSPTHRGRLRVLDQQHHARLHAASGALRKPGGGSRKEAGIFFTRTNPDLITLLASRQAKSFALT